MRSKKRVLGILMLSLCLLDMKGQMMPEFIFPRPTGSYAVGTKLFELTDPTRIDPESGNSRELVVQVWYPAKGKLGVATVPYAYEVREWYKKAQGVAAENAPLLDGIRTYAIPDAPVCEEHAPYPLVIFGHGQRAPRGAYSLFCEEIASHGYVVTMVMHTYITFLTRFSDGREITKLREPKVAAVIEECFADIEFMLNRAKAGAFGLLTQHIDFTNVGMVGHSLGGIMTAQVCRRDARIKAGISLDAPLLGIDATKPLHKPFLFIRTPNFYEDMRGVLEYQKELLQGMGVTLDNFYGSLERFCRENGKDTKQIVVEGSNHMTFMDEPIIQELLAKIAVSSAGSKDSEETMILPLPAPLDTIRGCIVTFLNRYLKGQEATYPLVVQHDADQESFEFYIPDPHPKHVKINIDPLLLDAYAGQYQFDGGMVLAITKDEGNLYAQVAGDIRYPIYPESKTRFFYTAADMQLSFVKDENGNVTQLILHQIGGDLVAQRLHDHKGIFDE